MSEEILSELQLLQAMYDPSQVHFDDPEVALKIENGIAIQGSISLTLKLNSALKLNLRIPQGYPASEKLSASVSSCETAHESQLNTLLSNWIRKDKDGTCNNILGVVNWVNEQWEETQTHLNEKSQDHQLPENSKDCCRIWIHSHHIYNEKKRKFIVDTASSLDLKGFSLPGKPGFICVEGDPANCDEFWSQVRQLTWQKISLIERQIFTSDDKVFSKFEELLVDKSAFMKYLEDKNVSFVIKDYLGF